MTLKKTYKSDAFEAIHTSVSALHKIGSVDKAMLDQFETSSIAEPAKLTMKFSELRSGMSQVARERSDAQAKVMLAKMPLNELD